MATIDREGLLEVKKVRNALEHLYTKLEAAGVASQANEEYGFIYKILGEMETSWNHEVNHVYTMPDEVQINGKTYKS